MWNCRYKDRCGLFKDVLGVKALEFSVNLSLTVLHKSHLHDGGRRILLVKLVCVAITALELRLREKDMGLAHLLRGLVAMVTVLMSHRCRG